MFDWQIIPPAASYHDLLGGVEFASGASIRGGITTSNPFFGLELYVERRPSIELDGGSLRLVGRLTQVANVDLNPAWTVRATIDSENHLSLDVGLNYSFENGLQDILPEPISDAIDGAIENALSGLGLDLPASAFGGVYADERGIGVVFGQSSHGRLREALREAGSGTGLLDQTSVIVDVRAGEFAGLRMYISWDAIELLGLHPPRELFTLSDELVGIIDAIATTPLELLLPSLDQILGGALPFFDTGNQTTLDQTELAQAVGFQPFSFLPASLGGYYSADMSEYTNLLSNGRSQTIDLDWFQSHVSGITGGWTPPPGTHVVPRAGGFEIRNDDGSDWNNGETGRPSPKDDGGYTHNPNSDFPSKKTKPILLDLDGTGLSVTELDASTVYVDSTNDGLLNRTAWAGAGDGVLFYDADGNGEITSTREFVFTEWDPTAASDLEALASVFDANGDGKLTAADDGWANFKVMVTQADSLTVRRRCFGARRRRPEGLGGTREREGGRGRNRGFAARPTRSGACRLKRVTRGGTGAVVGRYGGWSKDSWDLVIYGRIKLRPRLLQGKRLTGIQTLIMVVKT